MIETIFLRIRFGSIDVYVTTRGQRDIGVRRGMLEAFLQLADYSTAGDQKFRKRFNAAYPLSTALMRRFKANSNKT